MRNTRKRDKNVEEKLASTFLSISLQKVFDMDFLQKMFLWCVVFLNSPYRETPKNVLKKRGGESSAGGWVGGSKIW
jgi:hypothetical protein